MQRKKNVASIVHSLSAFKITSGTNPFFQTDSVKSELGNWQTTPLACTENCWTSSGTEGGKGDVDSPVGTPLAKKKKKMFSSFSSLTALLSS